MPIVKMFSTTKSKKLLYQIGYLITPEEQVSYKMINKDNEVTLSLCWPSKKHEQIDFKTVSTEISGDIIFKNHLKNFILSKNIYTTLHNNDVWEIHEYTGRSQGLILGINQSNNDGTIENKPDWVGKEVTNLAPYSEDVLKERPYSEIEIRLDRLLKQQIFYMRQGNDIHINNEHILLFETNDNLSILWDGRNKFKNKLQLDIFPIFHWEFNNEPLEDIYIYAYISKQEFMQGANHILDCKYFYNLKIKGKSLHELPTTGFFLIKEMLLERNYYSQFKTAIERAFFMVS